MLVAIRGQLFSPVAATSAAAMMVDTAENVLSKIMNPYVLLHRQTPHQSSKLNEFLSADDDLLLPQLGFQPLAQRAPEL